MACLGPKMTNKHVFSDKDLGAEIHQSVLSQFSLIAEFSTLEFPVKN